LQVGLVDRIDTDNGFDRNGQIGQLAFCKVNGAIFNADSAGQAGAVVEDQGAGPIGVELNDAIPGQFQLSEITMQFKLAVTHGNDATTILIAIVHDGQVSASMGCNQEQEQY